MAYRKNREHWRNEQSLLSLVEAVRGEDEASLVLLEDRAGPSWREDAATRHRLARSRREACASPILLAAAGISQPDPDEPKAGTILMEEAAAADGFFDPAGSLGGPDAGSADHAAYRAAPPPAQPVEVARTKRPGPIGAVLSALSRLMPGRAPEEMASGETSAATNSTAAMPPAFHPQPLYAGRAPYPQQPTPPHSAHTQAWSRKANQASEAADQQSQIEEIRASLREFREVVRELTENRARRRYF
ncbi:hypothetical protein NKH84_24950 [Mesorhizobium sp. M0902]|uniref:hypothetical protein n=1 Tax=unclassified Mesorhizobium TaxID=325217 RepID=UPI0012EBDE3B|nr:hypothetical protein [Mesorhizobium sp. LSJC280B00]